MPRAQIKRAKLLDRHAIPVAADVFLHGLSPLTLKYMQNAMEQGLTPSGLDIGADGIVILRLTKPALRRAFPNA